jgi:hypothetical protein
MLKRFACQPGGLRAGVRLALEQGAVGVDDVGVGGHGVEVAVPAVGGADAGDPAVRGVDAFDGRAEPDGAAELLEELDERRAPARRCRP